MSQADTSQDGKPSGSGTRRSFFARVAVGWTFFVGACAAGAAMVGRFFFPNDRFEPPTRFTVGYPEDYAASAEGFVSEKYTSRGIWVVRNLDGFYVLATICTHLGCTPVWQEAERRFRCPCHGSSFYVNGVHYEGPAPRPLERYKVGVTADGLIEVDKSKTYQQELGQWDDPDAFLPWKAAV